MQSQVDIDEKVTKIAQVKLGRLSMLEIEELTANDGSLRLMNCPRLDCVVQMSQKKLLSLLRLCPLSDYFG